MARALTDTIAQHLEGTSALVDKTTVVVGASRGLGHGIATAFADAADATATGSPPRPV